MSDIEGSRDAETDEEAINLDGVWQDAVERAIWINHPDGISLDHEQVWGDALEQAIEHQELPDNVYEALIEISKLRVMRTAGKLTNEAYESIKANVIERSGLTREEITRLLRYPKDESTQY